MSSAISAIERAYPGGDGPIFQTPEKSRKWAAERRLRGLFEPVLEEIPGKSSPSALICGSCIWLLNHEPGEPSRCNPYRLGIPRRIWYEAGECAFFRKVRKQ